MARPHTFVSSSKLQHRRRFLDRHTWQHRRRFLDRLTCQARFSAAPTGNSPAPIPFRPTTCTLQFRLPGAAHCERSRTLDVVHDVLHVREVFEGVRADASDIWSVHLCFSRFGMQPSATWDRGPCIWQGSCRRVRVAVLDVLHIAEAVEEVLSLSLALSISFSLSLSLSLSLVHTPAPDNDTLSNMELCEIIDYILFNDALSHSPQPCGSEDE